MLSELVFLQGIAKKRKDVGDFPLTILHPVYASDLATLNTARCGSRVSKNGVSYV